MPDSPVPPPAQYLNWLKGKAPAKSIGKNRGKTPSTPVSNRKEWVNPNVLQYAFKVDPVAEARKRAIAAESARWTALANSNRPGAWSLPAKDEANQNQGAVGTSGSGSGGSGGTPVNPLLAALMAQKNPIEDPYNALIANAQKLGGANLTDIDALKAQIAKNYDGATQGLYDQYQNSRKGLDSQAAALGVGDFNIYKGYDADLRKIQENSDQSKAQDESWFDKMKSLRGDELTSLYTSLETEKAAQLALWQAAQAERAIALQGGGSGGGGGGSGRRGSGGGSGSGTVKETGTMTETLNNPYSLEGYQALLQRDPLAADLYLRALIQTSDNKGAAALSKGLDSFVANMPQAPKFAVLPTPKVNNRGRNSTTLKGVRIVNNLINTINSAAKKAQAAKNSKTKQSYMTAIQQALANGGALGIPTQSNKIVTTSSQRSTR